MDSLKALICSLHSDALPVWIGFKQGCNTILFLCASAVHNVRDSVVRIVANAYYRLLIVWVIVLLCVLFI